MAAAKGGTPLSSAPSFALPLNVSVQLSSSTHCSLCLLCASPKLSPAASVFDRSRASKGLWGRHKSSQAIKQLHTLKVVTSTFNMGRQREGVCAFVCVCVPGMCEFLGAEEREAGWRDESRRME